MKRFLILLGALLIMQTISSNAIGENIIWMKQTHDVKCLQFSPDGTMIATTSDGQVLIHDVETKETLHEYNPILNARFTPDGKYIVGYFNTNEIIVIDVATWQRRDNIQPAPSNIRAYDFSTDGKKIIASYKEKYEYSIWDIESGQIEKTVRFPIEDSVNSKWAEMYSIFFGKDDRTIIFTTNRAVPYSKPPYYELVQSTHIVDAVSHEEKFKMDKLAYINISNDKSMIADRFGDKNVAFRLVNSNNWDIILTIPGVPTNIENITFSNDDKYLVYSGGNRITIYDIQLKKIIFTYDDQTSYSTLSVSKNNQYIASGVSDYLILLQGKFNSTSVKEDVIINEFKTYPNPTSNSINFEFNLKKPGITTIWLYDLTGRKIRNVENRFLDVGLHKYIMDLKGLVSGQYNLVIETPGISVNHKIIVNK